MKKDNWVLLNARMEEDGRIVLEPQSSRCRERIEKRMKDGRGQIRAEVARIRSVKQLNLYWPWIREVVINSGTNLSEKLLHGMLLLACGYSEPYITIEGDIHMMPSSIAIDKMNQDEFDDYFERAQKIVSEKILPGVDLKSLMTRVKDEFGWSREAA